MTIRTRPAATDEHARDRLRELVEGRDDYAGISRQLLRRPPGYLSRYVRKGVPKRLGDEEVGILAGYFGVEPCELSAGWR